MTKKETSFRSSFFGLLWYSIWNFWILRLNTGSNVTHDMLKAAYVEWKKRYEFDRLEGAQKAHYNNYNEISLPDIEDIEGWMVIVYPLAIVLSAVTIFFVVGACVTTIGYAFMQFNPGELSDPNRQILVPTITPVSPADETPFLPEFFWYDDVDWLTVVEANALRQQENVVNLALLESGGAWYAQGITVNFDASSDLWEQTHPFIVTQLGVDGTSLFVTINENDYYLNVYQPFVEEVQPNLLMLVDASGILWAADLESIDFVSIEDAEILMQIEANPDLTPTYQNR